MSRGVELPWHVFGRRIRPFSFTLMLATLVIAQQFFLLQDAPGDGFTVQHFMGTLAMMGGFCLFLGWVLINDAVHDVGLLIVSGVWIGRTYLFAADDSWQYVGTYLSACWAMAAIGAWFIERYDHKWQHIVAERRERRLGGADG